MPQFTRINPTPSSKLLQIFTTASLVSAPFALHILYVRCPADPEIEYKKPYFDLNPTPAGEDGP
jgi:hypothetical protein